MVIVENKRRSSLGSGWRNDGSEHPILSEATIKIKTKDEIFHTAAEGNGPVGALDNATRKALIGTFPEINKIRLTDYIVRVVEEGTGTGAVVRVIIESSDEDDVIISDLVEEGEISREIANNAKQVALAEPLIKNLVVDGW